MDRSGVDHIELGQVELPASAHPEFCLFGSMEEISALVPEGTTDWRRWVAMYNDIHIPPEKVPDWRPGLCGTVRVVLRYSEQAASLDFCRMLKEKGYSVFLQVALYMRYTDAELARLCQAASDIALTALYCADSNGYMRPADVERALATFDGLLDPGVAMGFHAHNHSQMAYANALRALEFPRSPERTLYLDACVLGCGRGAGNLKTELIAADLVRKWGMDLDMCAILDACALMEEVVGRPRLDCGSYSPVSALTAMHRCGYAYGVALVHELGLSYADAHRALCHLDDVGPEARHRFTRENLTAMLDAAGIPGIPGERGGVRP
jgi:4-hydroxy 2-oxovalerate aldolase